MPGYNPYASIPEKYIPTRADQNPLGDIIRLFREAVRLRHDLETAASLAAGERRLAPPTWESNLANSFYPNNRTTDGLSAEHARVAAEAQSYVVRINGNRDLRQLLQDNLVYQFPRILPGGRVQRVLPAPRGILDMFKPLGVEEDATFINILLRNRNWQNIWW